MAAFALKLQVRKLIGRGAKIACRANEYRGDGAEPWIDQMSALWHLDTEEPL